MKPNMRSLALITTVQNLRHCFILFIIVLRWKTPFSFDYVSAVALQPGTCSSCSEPMLSTLMAPAFVSRPFYSANSWPSSSAGLPFASIMSLR